MSFPSHSSFWLGIAAILGATATHALAQTTSAAPQGQHRKGPSVDPVHPTVLLGDVTASAGLDDVFTSSTNTYVGGAAWIDYNGDFWPDLFLSNGENFPNRLYRNNGDGTFSDASSLVPKSSISLEAAGGLFADIDNDGDEDLLEIVDNPELFQVSNPTINGGPNHLFVNQGDGTFVESASSRGIVDSKGRRNIAGGWADYDRDGFIDLHIAHWQLNSALVNNEDRMLHNNGSGTFVSVKNATRTGSYGRDGLCCLWFDANLDGYPDLYVGNVGTAGAVHDNYDLLYLYEPDLGFFCDGTGNPHVIGDDAEDARGLDVGDVDNDGDWDLYVTDAAGTGTAPQGNVLYLGNGDGTFQDNSCDVAGVCGDDSWACNFADFDRDGWVDLWVGTTASAVDDQLFLNDRDGTFSLQTPAGFVGNEVRGGTIADYDGDGDVDVIVVNYNQSSRLLRNDTVTGGNWIALKLLGTESNRSAIGATIHVTADGITQMRRVTGGDSAHSQGELAVHFGIQSAATVDVTIDWPSGGQDVLSAVPANLLHFVDEDLGLLAETLSSATADWSLSQQTLTVDVRSSFGGRSGLAVDAFGPLGWDATSTSFAASFAAVASNPGSITLQSSRGGTWSVPVTEVP